MRNTFIIGTLIAAGLVFSGNATAQGKSDHGDLNLNLGFAETGAEAGDVVENEWETYLYDEGEASSNCQVLIGVQTLAVSVAAVDHLGLITDDDTYNRLREFFNGGAMDITYTDNDEKIFEDTATAPCEQHIGAVRVSITSSDGFGEPAPVADAASALEAGAQNQEGDGDLNANVGIAGAHAGVFDVVRNDADAEHYDEGTASSNCQILVGWQTAVLGVSTIEQTGTIEDDDETNIADEYVPVESTNREHDIVVEDDDTFLSTDGGTATCVQTVESITLSQGPIRIPPQS